MAFKNSKTRYGTYVIALHWLMLVLLVAVYASIELRDLAPKGSELRANLKTLHFSLGLSVLALVVVRLGARWSARAAPAIEPPVAAWSALLARLMHFALYAFMVTMPILGWLALSAASKPVNLFGWPLPMLIGANEALAHPLKDVHEMLATAGYVLIGLHAAAALLHHYAIRDNTLLRMLPAAASGKNPRSGESQ